MIKRFKKGLKHKKSNIIAIMLFVICIVLVWFGKATLMQVTTALPVIFTFLMYKGKEKKE